jgi:hypothetical protein
MKAAADRTTTITMPTSVRRRLLDYQLGGKSASEAISDLMDKVPPDFFREDLRRALVMSPRIELSELRRRHSLHGRTAGKASKRV